MDLINKKLNLSLFSRELGLSKRCTHEVNVPIRQLGASELNPVNRGRATQPICNRRVLDFFSCGLIK
jgi:hypothetical protein